ncbi:MAG: hypothetical protein AAGF73_05020 [Actinomycetota bacterium]
MDERASHAERNRQLLGFLRYTHTVDDAVAAGASDAPQLSERSPTGLIDAIADLGFEPRDITGADALRLGDRTIELCACPHAAAVEAPGGELVCAYHRGMVEALARESGAAVAGVDVVPPSVGRCQVHLTDLPLDDAAADASDERTTR